MPGFFFLFFSEVYPKGTARSKTTGKANKVSEKTNDGNQDATVSSREIFIDRKKC